MMPPNKVRMLKILNCGRQKYGRPFSLSMASPEKRLSAALVSHKTRMRGMREQPGAVYGNGKNIYRGAFISCGKIDPLFTGKLRIRVYNGGAKKIVLKTGDKLAYAVFFQTESDILSDQLSRATEVPSIREKLGVWTILGRFVSDHSVIIATITSMLALAISGAKIFV